MKRFCKFSVHEYMDMYPHMEVLTFQGADEAAIKASALEWAEFMTKAYSGGPTHFEGVMSKDDATEYIVGLFKENLLDMRCLEEDFIENLRQIASKTAKAFFECYR